jgi:hypothetical protein
MNLAALRFAPRRVNAASVISGSEAVWSEVNRNTVASQRPGADRRTSTTYAPLVAGSLAGSR